MKVFTKENTTAIITKQRFLLMAVILFIPFNQFPISLPLAGGTLSLCCLYIGYLFFAYELFIQSKSLSFVEKQTFIFLAIVVIWEALTDILGIFNFPYFSWVSLNQLDNFQNFYENIVKLIPIDELIAIKGCLSYRAVRAALVNIVSTYLISVWVYHLYRNNWEQAFTDFRRVLLILCACLTVYSVFEIDYLIGGTWGKSILEEINPIYMKIEIFNGWWPPLLWQGQLRSLFAEPSFFGIFCAMAVPMFFSYFYERIINAKTCFGIILYLILVIMLTLSQARTGTILFIGELFLLLCWQMGIYRKNWRRFCAIIIGTCLGFAIGLAVLTQFYSPKSFTGQQEVSVENYLQQNVSSAVGNQRSNNARSADARATTLVGFQHPLFGVGHNFKAMYVDKNLSIDDKNVPEVKGWSEYMYKKGPFKSSYPGVNQLAEVFAEQGIIGLLLFLFPVGGIIKMLYTKRWLLQNIDIVCMTIALCGLCVAFFSSLATVAYYLVIGYMLVIIFYDKDGRQENE